MPRMRLGWCLVCGITLLAACSGASAPTPPPTSPQPTGIPTPSASIATATVTGTPQRDRIDQVFLQLLTVYQAQGLDAAKQFTRDQGLVTAQDEVRITLGLDSDDPSVVDGTALAIGRLGGRVTATFGNMIELVAPVPTLVAYGKQATPQSFLNDLADFRHVRGVLRTPTTQQSATPPAGPGGSDPGGAGGSVALTGAGQWQAAGITGKGVKVGIIDVTFNQYQQFLGTAKVTTRSFRSDKAIEDRSNAQGIHGTACAEIVREMAPDADLYLVTFDTPGEFIAAMRWLVDNVGVSAISTSIGFAGEFPTDDTGALAREIDRAKAAGVFVVKSAGNAGNGLIGTDIAEGHFSATFRDSDGDSFHDFPGGKTPDALQIKIGSGPFSVVLNWDDWQRPHITYDLLLYDATGREVARSDTDQSAGRMPPVQVLQGTLQAGTYALKVKKVKPSDADLLFHIFFRGSQMEQVTPASSLTSPGDARGAFTVAAIDVQTGKVESFSSQGATMDGRTKPELAAPDNVFSFAYTSIGIPTFHGTSAAAPHVAGAAALYKQAFPDATPDVTFRFLAEHARKPQGALAGDNISGAGLLFLDAPPRNANINPAPNRPSGGTATAGTAVPMGTVFTDNFSSPASGLPPQGYQGGAYRVRAEPGNLAPATYPRVVQTAGAETYEVQAQKTGGADDALLGLEIHRVNDDNYLLFVITNDGLYGVFARVNGSLRTVGDAGASPAIRANGINALRVSVRGTQYTFSVNGQTVTQVDIADGGTQGTFGVVAGGGKQAPAEIAFTDYRVTIG